MVVYFLKIIEYKSAQNPNTQFVAISFPRERLPASISGRVECSVESREVEGSTRHQRDWGALVPETVSLLTPRKSVQGSRWEYLTRGGQIQ